MSGTSSGASVIGVAVLPGMPLFEVAVPCEVFGTPRPGLVEPPYDVRLCSDADGVDLGIGILRVDHRWSDLAGAGTVIVPALAAWDAPVPSGLVEALKAAHRKGARVVGLCTGAFALGKAGLLDGRDATTHWMYAQQLADRNPLARVDRDVLWAGDERVLTSAGTASGLDLCLELVGRDHGAAIANDVARRMVTAPHRTGGQSQFVAWSSPPTNDRGLAPALDWALEHLHEEIGPAELAVAAHVSIRTLSRRFYDSLGITPAGWILEQRVRRCQELLETTAFPIQQVTAMAGFASPSTMRSHFARLVGTSPSDYRRTFGGAHQS
jgi:AraC family transcriptional activator FtrA